MSNIGLVNSIRRKQNEFYTLYKDVEYACNLYQEQFYNKVIYLNADNYLHSNIYKFFKNNFIKFRLKKLIATCYSNQEINSNDKPYKAVCENVLGQVVETVTVLKGNGDFASHECLEILKSCDIVVTNPPFSLFRVFMACIKEYNKKFFILINFNNLFFADIFPDVMTEKISIACPWRVQMFEVPKSYTNANRNWREKDGKFYASLGNVVWATNLKTYNYHNPLELTEPFDLNKGGYKVFDDNPDIINVNRVKDIPYNYYGKIAVPVSFLLKYYGWVKEAYKLVGILSHRSDNKYDLGSTRIDGKRIYKRLIIQRY